MEELLTEDDIFDINKHIFILGDPGSGKSTTLKRLIYNKFFSPEQTKTLFTYPILVRFRSIDNRFNLYTYLANLFGINYETRVEHYDEEVKTKIMEKAEDKDGEEFFIEKIKTTIEKRERTAYYFDNINLETFISELLESNGLILIMDGFDEIQPEISDLFLRQIMELGLKLNKTKIFVTARPNYIKSYNINSCILFIKELSKFQIETISKLWLSDYETFINQLKQKSYSELANRPLFLNFLILLYKEGYHGERKKLPKVSKDVYSRIIELLIEKWDESRNIIRISKYGLYFDVQRKLEFLSNLAFELTYVLNEKSFSHETLKSAYLGIYENFDLPKNEAELVVEELENHTGIFIKAFYSQYEFSHLAIQEYLCARFIVSTINNDSLQKYLIMNPVPLALVISLSSDPVAWLYEVVLQIERITDHNEKTEVCTKVLSRLFAESPNFKSQDKLGVSFLKLSTICDCNNINFVNIFETWINSTENVLRSILNVLSNYSLIGDYKERSNCIIYQRIKNHANNFYPSVIAIPISTEKKILNYSK